MSNQAKFCQKKRALFSAFFVLVTSCSSDNKGWTHDEIACNAPSPYSRAYLPAENTFRNLELVIVDDGIQKDLFLNAYGSPFERDKKGQVEIVIEIDGNAVETTANCLEGCHRLKLHEAEEKLILSALQERKPIKIRAGRYSLEVRYDGFNKQNSIFNIL